jgi:UDP:flavonoid glycosyltransferase YjiC (YdhE family)
MPRKPRILFIAEAVSLAHLVRLASLAEALDARRYEVWFASARFPDIVFAGTQLIRRTIESQASHSTLARVARGQRPWDADVLDRYVASDLRMLQEVRPDLVVGDLRLSLAVSAPLSGTPYASMINAYWSPYALRSTFPIPEHPLVRLLGVKRVARGYRFALPLVFQHFTRPINQLRRRYGLPYLGGLLEALTFGDFTLYPDVPALAPTRDLPPNHRYLGTLSWSPRAALPSFWNRMDHRRPLVYVTLGSSGELGPIRAVLEAARRLPVTMLVATAGRFVPDAVPENVWVTDFVPGDAVSRRAALVICNGGSTTGYQALEQGTPVLGLPFNFDQYLAAEAIVRTGAGLYVRSGHASAATVSAAIEQLLSDPRFAASAQRLRTSLERWDARRRFSEFVDEAVGAPRALLAGVPGAAE